MTPEAHAKALARQRRAEQTAREFKAYAASHGAVGRRPPQAPVASLDVAEAAQRLAWVHGASPMQPDALVDYVLATWRARKARKGKPSDVVRLGRLAGGAGAFAVRVHGRSELLAEGWRFQFPRRGDEPADHPRDLRKLLRLMLGVARRTERALASGPQSCDGCGRQYRIGEVFCPSCRRWRLPPPKVTGDMFVDAYDVEAAAVDRIVTGTPFDAAFGSGFVPGVSLLFARPGAGKSTLAYQIGAAISDVVGRPALLVNHEQPGSEVAFSLERLGLMKSGRFNLFRNFGEMHEFEGRSVAGPPSIVIVDSLSSICGRAYEAQVRLCRAMKEYSLHWGVVMVAILHVIKAEGAASGPMSLLHWADATIELRLRKDGSRVLRAIKSRHGPTGQDTILAMTEAGLGACSIAPEMLG